MKQISLPLTIKNSTFIIFLFLLTGCPEPDEPIVERDTAIFLTLDEVWATTATLTVSAADTTQSWEFALYRNDSLITTATVTGIDTSIEDVGLSMGDSYAYQAFFMDDRIRLDSSEVITASTMRPTNHDITWEVITFGLYGSLIRSVDIVSEDNIWIAGQFYLADPDSSFDGTGTRFCNVAHWNGTEWEMMHVHGYAPYYTIKYFSDNNIWVTSVGFPLHWDGYNWILYQLEEMGLNTGAGQGLWANEPSNIYFVGMDGGFVQYNGQSFRKIRTSSEMDYLSVSGNSRCVLATGYEYLSKYSELIRYIPETGEVTQLYYGSPYNTEGALDSISGPLTAVMACDDHRFVMTSTYGLYLWDDRKPDTFKLIPLNPNDLSEYFRGWPEGMGGTGFNDVFIVGQSSGIYHFNGQEYYRYPDQISGCRFFDVAATENLVVVVGLNIYDRIAVIIKGERP